jgi:hypothetical protein
MPCLGTAKRGRCRYLGDSVHIECFALFMQDDFGPFLSPSMFLNSNSDRCLFHFNYTRRPSYCQLVTGPLLHMETDELLSASNVGEPLKVLKHDNGQANILGSNPSLPLRRSGPARRKTSKELS